MGPDLMEPFQNFLVDGIEAFAKATWEFIKGAFSAGEMNQEWWAAVVGGEITVTTGADSVTTQHPGMLNVVVLAMVPLLIILVTIQVVYSLIRGSTAGLLRAAAVGVFAIPTVYALTGIVWLILGGVDALTQGILAVGSDDTEHATADILALFGMAVDSTSGEVLLDENYEYWQIMNDDASGKAILSWIIAAVLLLCGFALMLMMIFRLVAVIVMVIFMPIAVYGLAAEAAKAMFTRWTSLVVALIISKPAAAVIVKTGLTLGAVGNHWVQLVAGIVLVLVAALMPLLSLAFIAFITSGSSDSMERAAIAGAMTTSRMTGSARRATTGAARSGRQMMGGPSLRNGRKNGGGPGSSGPNSPGRGPRPPTSPQPSSSGKKPMSPSSDQKPSSSGGGRSSRAGAKQPQPTAGTHRSSRVAVQQPQPTPSTPNRQAGPGSARAARRGDES